ncbi:uncharacterized protein SCODWIG_04001 [Saccharomycodes ludwigii]|uniref:Flo11 domain-containing protein n=1 Tax=Saccharomycodes ludwigii TaxID=36035 RepID=A0A376BC19_9ASCO|nr:uncharacterized protein SCODWIG_04001 [Saccharomycodes ludwigii]
MKISTLTKAFVLAQAVVTNAYNCVPSGHSTQATCSGSQVCPDLNFDFHRNQLGIPKYNMQLQNVQWETDNIYWITIRVYSDTQISIDDLFSVKIIGVNSPDGSTFQLYDRNLKVANIDSPTDFEATFRIYADVDGSTATSGSFQIQWDYCKDVCSDTALCKKWPYGDTSFDLQVSCNADNQNNAQGDFPVLSWNVDCSKSCVSSQVSASTSSNAPSISSGPGTTSSSIPYSSGPGTASSSIPYSSGPGSASSSIPYSSGPGTASSSIPYSSGPVDQWTR